MTEKRPPIGQICYIDADGNPHLITLGNNGVTEIRETEESGEYAMIPWVEIWAGKCLVARFSQHKLEHIFYMRESESQ